MAKWHGVIGYQETVEVAPGVWEERVTTREYSGNVLEYRRRYQSGEKLTDDLTVTNKISVLADPFLRSHSSILRFVSFAGAYWKVSEIGIEYPRLTLTLGGLYNGEVPN